MIFFKKDKATIEKELIGLKQAFEILNERYEKKTIDIDEFTKKCDEMTKKIEKLEKKLEKFN